MADQINISGLERRIDAVTAATNRIEREIVNTNSNLQNVTKDISAVNEELRHLKKSFESFMQENKKATSLQKAATELIRVRQELEQNFGSYKIVRETMLGVLQATDLALVKKTTISQVTEELMLSTPDYWLAPCLVAISAWIGNDRDLADRAIAEAVKRDEEKTALAMALICRRNNRSTTCFEWLSIYFNRQSAANFTESNFTYLNAYLSGVFGPDEKHMCDDYVAKWMREIQSNGEDLEAKQTERWKAYCEDFTVNLEGQFPQLSDCVHEYRDIYAYVSRINSVNHIANNFSRIKNVEIDQQKLKKDVDKTLIELISRYDIKEEPLRKEERYLQAIRYFDGDTSAAKASVLAANQRKTEETIDLIEQMTNIIVKKEHPSPSERKTSLNFLSSYIQSGFNSYITEKKTTFPEHITMQIEGWSGTTTDGNNGIALQNDFKNQMEQQRTQQLQAKLKKPMQLKITCAVLAIIGVICLAFAFPLSILCWGGAVFCFLRASKAKSDIIAVNAEFDEKIVSGKQRIEEVLAEWKQAQTSVQEFERESIRDVVA